MLTSKQRAYLRALGSGEDTILIVGKSGVTKEVIKQADDALLARELIKGKVLDTCETGVWETALELSEKTKGELVQVIGSKFLIYRRNNERVRIILPERKRKK